jgi:formyl-CoA transferase
MGDDGKALWAEHAGPLKGLRVLDLSQVIAGPFAGNLFADFGAHVVKVEQPGPGDAVRMMGPFARGQSLRWPSLNRNKKAISLDLRHPAARPVVERLVAWADVVLESFRPGTLEKWGWGPAELRRINPRVVLVRISGYGQSGPCAYKAGYGTPATAFSGYTYLQGFPDRPPLNSPISLADLVAGLMGAMAGMMALYHRDAQRGPAQDVDVSLYEPLFRLLDALPAEYVATGRVRERQGNELAGSSPAGIYQTKDGKWVVLVCSTERPFRRLAQAMGRSDMIGHPKFATNLDRVRHRDEVEAIVTDWVSRHTYAEVQGICDEAGVPVCLVNSIADIMADPQFQARENIVTLDHPDLGPFAMPGAIPRFSETPGKLVHVGPKQGEHTRAILRGVLGMSDEEVAALEQSGALSAKGPPGGEDGREAVR